MFFVADELAGVLGMLRTWCFQSNNRCNACSLVFAHMVRYTSCRAFLMTLNELNDYAGQHEVIAENLSTQIISELVRYIQELKAERKAVCARKLGQKYFNGIILSVQI